MFHPGRWDCADFKAWSCSGSLRCRMGLHATKPLPGCVRMRFVASVLPAPLSPEMIIDLTTSQASIADIRHRPWHSQKATDSLHHPAWQYRQLQQRRKDGEAHPRLRRCLQSGSHQRGPALCHRACCCRSLAVELLLRFRVKPRKILKRIDLGVSCMHAAHTLPHS